MERAPDVSVYLGIAILTRRLNERLRGARDGAARAAVEGHIVLGLIVCAFDDIDFALGWPPGPAIAERPESGPCTASATRHVCHIDHGKHVSVGVLGGKPDAITAAAGRHVVEVDPNVDRAVGVLLHVAGTVGSALIDVVDVTVGRVIPGEEIELIEESLHIIISDGVASLHHLREACGRKDRGLEMHCF